MNREIYFDDRLAETSSTQVLQKQLGMEWLQGPWLKARSVRHAVLLGLHLPYSYFPFGKESIGIYYDQRFLEGYDSLRRYRNILGTRKYVAVQDREAVAGMRRFRSFEDEAAMCHPEGATPEESIVTFTSGGEPFYEVMAAFALREKGYIVFPESAWTMPFWSGLGGVPDLIAFKLGNFQKQLVNSGVIQRGAFLAEVEMFPLLRLNEDRGIEEVPDEAIAVEVEPEPKRASGGRKQLEAYLSSGLFDRAVLACPGRSEDEKWYHDSFITWNSEGNSVVRFPEEVSARRNNLALRLARWTIASLLLRTVKLSKLKKFAELNFLDLTERVCSSPELMDEIVRD